MLDRIIQEAPQFFGYYNVIFLLQAMFHTFVLSAVGCGVGLVIGMLLAVTRRTSDPLILPLRILVIFYVEIFRRVPFLVTLMLALFTFQFAGFDVPVFTVALVTVCLIASAFIAEIVRAGLDSVPQPQWDAAFALNMSYPQALYLVIFPQAWKIILPPAFSFFVLFIKDTALASQIGVLELTFAGKVLNNKGFSAALVFGSVLVLYFILSYPLTRFGKWLEKRLGPARLT